MRNRWTDHITAVSSKPPYLSVPPMSSRFSSLGTYCFPGDRIAIVPDKKSAKKAAILVELIAEVLQHGISGSDVFLILTEQEQRENESGIRRKLKEALSETVAEAVQIIAHQPGDRRSIAFLGVGPKGEPIGFCREIVDADLVIPVRGKSTPLLGPFAGIFPRFADQEAQMRFLEAQNEKISSVLKKRLAAEVAEAARLLGVVVSVSYVENEWTVCEG